MAKPDPRITLLHNVDLFAGLTQRELRTVLETAREWSFQAGGEVARQGEKGGRFYLILEGEAEVEIDGAVYAKLRPGDYFGEMALLDGGLRSATVRAVTPLKTLGIAVFNFVPLLREHPSISEKLLRTLSCRVRDLESKLAAAEKAAYLDASVGG